MHRILLSDIVIDKVLVGGQHGLDKNTLKNFKNLKIGGSFREGGKWR